MHGSRGEGLLILFQLTLDASADEFL
jgi:general stress protein 26